MTPWQEFDFLVAAADAPGAAVTRLGLWPILADGSPDQTSLDLSRALVDRLLVDRTVGLTLRDKIAALMLDDPDGEQAAELERFLREAADTDSSAAVVRLLDHPTLMIGALKPRFAGTELQVLELVSWRRTGTQVHTWSGLRMDAGETVPKLTLDRNVADGGREGARLEVRWNAKPTELPNGVVEYLVAIMSGDETLAGRTVPHKQKGPQKTVFMLEDFDELDESARFEAFVRIEATGTPVAAVYSEDFILEFGVHEGAISSTAGRIVRSMVEGAITLDTREDFDAGSREFHLRAHEDRQGYIAWRSPSGRSFRIFRPPLVREIEQDWTAQGGAPGRWSTRVRADGSRAEPVAFHPFERGACPEDLWDRLARATRRLCEEAAKGSGLLALVQGARVQWVEDYLLAWAGALEQGSPELALANTVELRTVSGRTLGLIVLPAHPVRLAWHAAYDQLAAHGRYEEG